MIDLPPPSTSNSISVALVYGAIATSVFTSAAFLVALVVAYLSKDQTNLSLLVGAVIATFSTVVNYWLGSSAGSQRKDELLRNSQRADSQ